MRETGPHSSDRGGPAAQCQTGGSLAERVLAHAQAGREVVQQFVALADSLN
jgi:hypothetical protein